MLEFANIYTTRSVKWTNFSSLLQSETHHEYRSSGEQLPVAQKAVSSDNLHFHFWRKRIHMAGASKRTYDITSLQRGLNLLRLFGESPSGLTAKQVAGLSRLPVSTVHRFLANLVTAGFLSNNEDGHYHLGIACFAIGQAAVGQLDIRRLSLPYLRELNQQTRETIHLTVRHGLSAVYVEKLDSPEPLRIHSRIGAAVPLHCTAVGKVMLAYMPQEEHDRILPELPMKRLTPNTVGSLQEMETELFRVRKNGYACDLEEHEMHIRCVAAPIWDHTGSVQSSLSITAPLVRMPVTRLRQLAPLIQAAGLHISRELGYLPGGNLASRASADKRQTAETRIAKV
jgi:IclR family acetate operon transcriptional repressor